jgi:hypothetical protein
MLLALLIGALFEGHAPFEKVGFYPLWENTGTLLDRREAILGTGYFEMGLGDVQVGIRPQEFLFRSPNLHAKVRLLARAQFEWSAHVEVLALLAGATSTFTSSNFVSRIDNSRGVLWVAPVGTTLSWFPADFAAVHTTLTMMNVRGAGQAYYASFGLASVAELRAFAHHAFLLHATEIGFWRQDQFILGASYRFSYRWFDAQIGYFYRFSPDGSQASPLLSVGADL